METLAEVMQDPARAQAVVDDGVRLIESEVQAKGGVSGLAVKTGFKTVQKVKPGLVRSALHNLLPEFAPAIDPFYAQGREAGDVKGHFTRHADAIAEAMLAVTDARARNSDHRTIRSAYDKLRGQAHKHTAAAVPRLAELIERHVR